MTSANRAMIRRCEAHDVLSVMGLPADVLLLRRAALGESTWRRAALGESTSAHRRLVMAAAVDERNRRAALGESTSNPHWLSRLAGLVPVKEAVGVTGT